MSLPGPQPRRWRRLPLVHFRRACFVCQGVLLAALVSTNPIAEGGEPSPPGSLLAGPVQLGDVQAYGDKIQRTMSLLASSTPEASNTVRVLFYGQSITAQDWWKPVAEYLRRRFPDADLKIENRAIGGFASQILVKTAETDLYPFYPDLVIFHVYGSHVEYEDIIRRTRERTTAEVLIQTDHMRRSADIDEPTAAENLRMQSNWSAWFNYVFLPGLANKYSVQLTDQRDLWKRYLVEYGLEPGDLLVDGVHLNDHGCELMASLVTPHLRRRSDADPEAWSGWVTEYAVGRDIHWRGGKTRLEFEGNRIDAVMLPGGQGGGSVLIDGKKPSDIPELYTDTRTTSFPGSNWPCLLRSTSRAPRIAEEWTLTLTEISDELSDFRFSLVGSATGPDGSGSRKELFVSDSGRVVIDPEDWNLDYAFRVHKRGLPEGFEVSWQTVPLCVDELPPTGKGDPSLKQTVTLAQGLSGGRHTIEVTGGEAAPFILLRVYRPPLMPLRDRGEAPASSP